MEVVMQIAQIAYSLKDETSELGGEVFERSSLVGRTVT